MTSVLPPWTVGAAAGIDTGKGPRPMIMRRELEALGNGADSAKAARDIGKTGDGQGRIFLVGEMSKGDAADHWKFNVVKKSRMRLELPTSTKDKDFNRVQIQIVDKAGKVVADSSPRAPGKAFLNFAQLTNAEGFGFTMEAGEYRIKIMRENSSRTSDVRKYEVRLRSDNAARVAFYTKEVARDPAAAASATGLDPITMAQSLLPGITVSPTGPASFFNFLI